jgi:hypothetical protein
MNPSFIRSYYPVDKIRFILIAREKISWNVKPGPFLVVSQLSWYQSSGNRHAIDISQNCLNWTKPYSHFPTMLCRSCHLWHMTRLCTASAVSSLVASFGRSSSPMLSLPLLNSSAHYFYSAIGRGLFPKCIHEVFMDFLGGHPFLTEVLNDGSDFNYLHLV